MGWSRTSVKRATVKKASIRNSLLFQRGIVGNDKRGHVEGVKRSAVMTTLGSEAEWLEFFRTAAKPSCRFRDRAEPSLMTGIEWTHECSLAPHRGKYT